jgi:hypothetical protein
MSSIEPFSLIQSPDLLGDFMRICEEVIAGTFMARKRVVLATKGSKDSCASVRAWCWKGLATERVRACRLARFLT